jgi:hypothetical protein
MLNASNVNSLAAKLVAIAEAARGACDVYHKSLETNLKRLGINPDSTSRMKTARAVLALTHALAGSRGAKAIETLAHAEIATSPEAMGTSFRKASELNTVFDHVRWDLFDILDRVDGERKRGAQAVLANLKEALESDELAVGLTARINELEGHAIKLLTPPQPLPPPPPPIGPEPVAPPVNGVGSGTAANLTLAAAQEVFREIEQALRNEKDARLDLTWTLHKGASNS